MPEYTTPNSKLHDYQNTYVVGELEHALRTAFSVGGTDTGLDMAADAADKIKEKDLIVMEYIRGKKDFISADLQEALLPVADSTIEFYEELEENLTSRAARAQDRLRYNELEFRTHLVVDDHTELGEIDDSKNAIHKSDLDCIDPLDDFDVTTPTVLMCAHSKRKVEKIYPFVPNDDVLTCTCGDKQRNTASPLCFHELAALFKMATFDLSPDGPDTWVQMVSPTNGEK